MRQELRLTDFKALTFDCYGTLIDWEKGICNSLRPWLENAGVFLSEDEVLEAFARFESAQQAKTPAMRYSELLATIHTDLANHWGITSTQEDAERFGNSVPDWPAFPDSAKALQYLKEHYQLVILSNVDKGSFKGSQKKLGVEFDAVYTAEDIGSYKPNPRNFEYMLERLAEQGVRKSDILHTAQSLFHDHVPATALGLATNWIDRRHAKKGWGATAPPPSEVRVDFRHESMVDFVRAHQEALKAK
jgi:2-haloalkanoic acid dehalogenase type II